LRSDARAIPYDLLFHDAESIEARRHRIRTAVAEHGIAAIYHFTRIENVPSILALGLLPRARVPATAIVSDLKRLDMRRDAVCVSITHPNTRMFFAKRQPTGDARWAVLELAPAILWELPCLFFTRNAATAGAACTPDCDLQTSFAMAAMFRRNSPAAMRLPACLPTNPQAEVLVRGAIAPAFIHRIHTASSTALPKRAIGDVPWVATPALFRAHPAYKELQGV
jgi:hypothetical protein